MDIKDMAQHTPGPWELKPIIENPDQPQPLQRHKWEVWHYQFDGFPDLFIGEVSETMSRTGEANAALIAAAPDMKEALIDVLDWYDEWMESDEPEKLDVENSMDAARVVIAAAEGE